MSCSSASSTNPLRVGDHRSPVIVAPAPARAFGDPALGQVLLEGMAAELPDALHATSRTPHCGQPLGIHFQRGVQVLGLWAWRLSAVRAVDLTLATDDEARRRGQESAENR